MAGECEEKKSNRETGKMDVGVTNLSNDANPVIEESGVPAFGRQAEPLHVLILNGRRVDISSIFMGRITLKKFICQVRNRCLTHEESGRKVFLKNRN